jgi:hypothetical protein
VQIENINLLLAQACRGAMNPEHLLKITLVCRKFGINSAAHLSAFIIFCADEGLTIPDAIGKYQMEDVSIIYSSVRKLMSGSPTRNDGLLLLDWRVERRSSKRQSDVKVKPIMLTEKGKELKGIINSIIQL